jgi:hypothetical protein
MTETEGVTFFEIAQAHAAQERRAAGRYSGELAAEVKAVPVYAQLPTNSPWHHDAVPDEPPLLDPSNADLLAAAPPVTPAPPKAPAQVTRREALR